MNASVSVRIFVFCAALFAAPLATADWASDEAQIRQSLAASVEAFNRGDLPGHLAIYDESVTFMTKDGPRPGIAPIEKAFREHYFRDGQAIQQLRFEQLAVRRLNGHGHRDRALGAFRRGQARAVGLVHAGMAADSHGLASGARSLELNCRRKATGSRRGAPF